MTLSAVYEIRNILNGKSYIGSTTNYQTRRTNHFSSLRHNRHPNPHLQSSFNKHSESAFVAKVLLICEPFELLRYEQALIDLYRPEYNMTQVAFPANKGNRFKKSLEAVEKTAAALRGRPRPDMVGKKIGLGNPPNRMSFKPGHPDTCPLEAHHRGAATLKSTNSQSERMKLWWATRKLAQGN